MSRAEWAYDNLLEQNRQLWEALEQLRDCLTGTAEVLKGVTEKWPQTVHYASYALEQADKLLAKTNLSQQPEARR